jgi:hypothetical protein
MYTTSNYLDISDFLFYSNLTHDYKSYYGMQCFFIPYKDNAYYNDFEQVTTVVYLWIQKGS